MAKAQKQNATPWYESNLLWVPVSLGVGIIVAVVAAMKQDIRWLLWAAWPCFGVTVWCLARRTREIIPITVLGVILVACCLLGLNIWLGPKTDASSQIAKTSDANVPKQPPKPQPKLSPSLKPSKDVTQHLRPHPLGSVFPNSIPTEQQAPPPETGVTVSAPNGIAIGGNAKVDSPTVNNYGPRIPQFLGIEGITKDPRGNPYPVKDSNGHALTSVRFYADAGWDNPIVEVDCDRPCTPNQAQPYQASVLLSPTFNGGTAPRFPQLAAFEFVTIKPMAANVYYVLTVASEDDRPVGVLRVVPFVGKVNPH